MVDIRAINNNQHKNLKIAPNPTFNQCQHRHFAPLVVQEIISAGQEFPIVFIKNAETGEFKTVALLGLKPEQNCFYSIDKWLADYVPQSLVLYPFLLSQSEQADAATLCLDFASDLINENNGDALFNDDGSQTSWLNKRAEEVVRYVEMSFTTAHFIKKLLDLDLLVQKTLTFKNADNEDYSLTGLYVIDEAKFNALPDQQFLEIKQQGLLPTIYAAMLSLHRVAKLIKLAN